MSLSVFLAGLALAQEPPAVPTKLVGTQEGKLPIILSAPHGGMKEVPGVPPRKGEGLVKGSKGFFTGRDTGTEELAQALSDAIEKQMGKKPYMVVARFHRRFIDANRPPEIAYESKQAKPTYDAYHQAINRYCAEVKKIYGSGLLLDLHGQGKAKDTIFRGTQNGKTVTLLRQRFGENAHTGPKSFFGLLAANGCKIHPTNEKGKEQEGLSGGFIVRHYGSHEAHAIDAIQLEFGGDYRTKDRRDDTAKKVATAVAEYSKLYLTVNPAKRDK